MKKWEINEARSHPLLPSVRRRTTGLQTPEAAASLAMCWPKHPRAQLWMPSRWHGNGEWAAAPLTVGPSSISESRAFSCHLRPPFPPPPFLRPSPGRRHLSYRPTWLAWPLLQYHHDTLTAWPREGQVFERKGGGWKGRRTGHGRRRWSPPSAGRNSHHWLYHLYNIRWFQQFHLMRKSTLSLYALYELCHPERMDVTPVWT